VSLLPVFMAAASAVIAAKSKTPMASPQSRGSPLSFATSSKHLAAQFGASRLVVAHRPAPPELEDISIEGDAKWSERTRSQSKTPTLLSSTQKPSNDSLMNMRTIPSKELGSLNESTVTGGIRTRGSRDFVVQQGFAAQLWPQMAGFVNSNRFEAIIGACIVANCATMGIQAELLLGKAGPLESVVGVSDHVFTAIFLLELLLRISFQGWRIYAPFSSWGGSIYNFMDMLLVIVTGVVANWVLPLFGIAGTVEIQLLTVLRAFRLIRLVRVAQRIDSFHDVWLLLRGLMESGRVLFWTVVVIFFITYMFAIFGVVLIGVELQDSYEETDGQDDGTLKGLVEITNGVFPMMYTLIQVLTLDSWTSVARPIQKYAWWSWVFFYLYIAVAVIVMMNLVTAVIVENALKNSQKDADEQLAQREREKQEELARFKHIFELLDADGNKEVSWDEFETAFEDPELSGKLRLYGIDPENCGKIFDLLDSGDGKISMEEFFEGIARMEGQAQSADLFRSSKEMEKLRRLFLQHHMEMQEDLNALAALVAPGAKLPQREGTLRRRAIRSMQRNPSKNSTSGKRTPEFASANSERGTPAVATAKELQHAQVEAATTSSDEMLARLTCLVTKLAADVAESRLEVRSSVEACNRRISTVAADLADIRNGVCPSGIHNDVSLRSDLCCPFPDGARVYSLPLSTTSTHQPKSEWASRLEQKQRELCNNSRFTESMV
jgi:hypothetical protein